MEIRFKDGSLRYYERTLNTAILREDTAETIVPDSRPDAAEVLLTDGQSCLRGKDVRLGSVAVAGVSELTALYRAGDGSVERLTADVPFEAELKLSGTGDADRIVASVRLASCEARLLSTRKLLVRAEVCVTVSVWSPRELAWAAEAETGGCAVELLREERTLYPVTAVEEKTFRAEEDLPRPAGKPAAAAVLYSRAVLRREAAEAVGSKLVVRGTAEITAVCLGAGGEISQTELSLPWSAFLELPEGEAELLFEPVCALTGCSVEASDGGFSVAVGGVVQTPIRSRREISFLSDAYGTDCELSPEYAEAILDAGAEERGETDAAVIRLEDLKRPGSLLSVTADCARPGPEKDGVRLPVTVKVLWQREDGRAELRTGRGEAFFAGRSGVPEAECGAPYASVTAAGTEVRVPVSIRLSAVRRENLRLLTGAGTAEAPVRDKPTVTLRYASEGDTVWSLGKEKRLPAASVRCYNGLGEGEEPVSGTLLLLAK